MTCITNFAYTAAASQQGAAIVTQATVETAIQVALALWQRNSSKSINNMQIDLANDQMELAEEIQAHAIIYYPREAALVADAFSETKLTTQYTGLAGDWGGLLNEAMEAGRQTWLEVMDDACLAPSACEDARWQRNGQLAAADMLSYAARQDESRTQILNDRRYARQLAVLGLGRGQLQALQGYQQIAMTAGGSASTMLIETVNSALNAYGYIGARAEPQRGWGVGIRDTWALARAPAAQVAAPVVAPTPQAVQREPIVPVGRIIVDTPRQVTKENELDDVPDLEMLRRRGEL